MIAVALAAAAACGQGSGAPERAPLRAVVACASAPAAALAAEALGEHVPWTQPVPENVDPAHWAPDRAVVQALRAARLALFSGAGLEAWAERASLPPSRVGEAHARELDGQTLELPVVRHTHGAGEEHSHTGRDPHVWLDPDLLAQQLARVTELAAERFPGARTALELRRPAVREGVARYRAALAQLAPRIKGQRLYAAWPCYGYLARALGAEVTNLSLDPWAPDGGANDGALRTLEATAATSAKVLLWPAPPPPALAERLEKVLGVRSVHFDAWLRSDPSGAPPLARLAASVERLAAALR